MARAAPSPGLGSRLLSLEAFALLAQSLDRIQHPLQQPLSWRRGNTGALKLQNLPALPTDLQPHALDFRSDKTEVGH
ncbi:MAG: hypothetical protein WA418_28465 [Bradyrhizobium sp.]